MKNSISTICLLSLLILIALQSCKKDKPLQPPAINFKAGSIYTQNGATVMVGHKLHFGLQARGTSESNITNLTIKKVLDNGTVITVMDTALFSEYIDIDKSFYQNTEPKATWTFSVMDRNRMTASITLVVNKDPNSVYGGIYYFPSITLGMQNNNTFGHFLNPSTGIVYKDDSATTNQNKIDMLCYFIPDDAPPSPAFSSAGEMDNYSTEAQTFYHTITNWTIRNYTLFDISFDNGSNTPLTAANFNTAQNDSLLIVSYHPIWGKKKFRFATTGKIIPFLTANGKLGLIKIINAENTDSGIIEIALKIQQ